MQPTTCRLVLMNHRKRGDRLPATEQTRIKGVGLVRIPDLAVFIIDHDARRSDLLVRLLKEAGLTPVYFDSVGSFMESCQSHEAGCLIIDVRLPGEGALALQGRLYDQGLTLPVIAVTDHQGVPVAVEMLRRGGDDLLLEPVDRDLLIGSASKCLQHCSQMREQRDLQRSLLARIHSLTRREQEVLAGVLEGKPSKVIAFELGISVKTVDVHRSRIMEKMKVKSLVQLVDIFLRQKLPLPIEKNLEIH